MMLTEVIAALTAILDAHGNLPVFHHDDWDYFRVRKVEYQSGDPVRFQDGSFDRWRHDPHVSIEGDDETLDLKEIKG